MTAVNPFPSMMRSTAATVSAVHRDPPTARRGRSTACPRPVLATVGLLMAVLAAMTATAQEAGGGIERTSRNPDSTVADAFATVDGATRYCENVADAASDARFARQAAALRRLEGEIEERIRRLEAKRAEYEAWLDKRNRFLESAEAGVVEIYARMRPDAASEQLAMMNDVTAAAILMKIDSRIASAILNEMEPDRAAQLTTIMVGIAHTRDPGQRT